MNNLYELQFVRYKRKEELTKSEIELELQKITL